MGQGVIQASFTAGELAPSLYGRIDLARYYTGLRTCRNFIVHQHGGVSNRTGSALVDELDGVSVLIPFQFSTVQTYVLVFGHYTMSVFKDGARVVYPVGHLQAGQPVVVTTLYPESALQVLKYTQNADVMTLCHPDIPQQQLSRYDHHDWRFSAFANVEGPFLDINVDTTKTVTASNVSGPITITAAVDMFTSDMVGQLFYLEQNPDASTKRWEVQKGITVNDVRRAGANYYRATASGTTGTIRPDHTEGASSDGDPGVPWFYLHSGSGIALITGFTDAKHVSATVVKRLPDMVASTVASRVISNVIATPAETSQNAIVVSNGHGFPSGASVTIQNVLGTTSANGTWPISVIDANQFELVGCVDTAIYISGGTATLSTAAIPTYKWAFEAWGGGCCYPATSTYYQQRQVFGSSLKEPQTVWMSRTKGYTDYGVSTPVLDDDAVTFTVASREVNEIRHMIELSELIMLTSGGEWVMKGSQDGVLTPSSVNVKRQSTIGCSHVPPVTVDSSALFVTEKGTQLRSLGYSFQQDAFIGNDLTVLAHHLFRGHRIVSLAYQRIPYSCVWAVRDDGVLLGLTYLPEQEVAGWHRHDTQGAYESVCCISEGGEDAVYVVVRREIGGVVQRFLERFRTRAFSELRDAFFVDCGLSYDGRNATATTMAITGGTSWDHTELLTVAASSTTGVNGGSGFGVGDVGDEIVFHESTAGIAYRLRIVQVDSTTQVKGYSNRTLPSGYRGMPRADWEFAHNTIAGLSHLEGMTVNILADGCEEEPRIVTGGVVTLDRPAAVVHAGLPIVADLETLDISSSGQNIRDKQKLINHVSLQVQESMGVMVGPDPGHLTEVKQRALENYDETAAPISTLVDLRVQASWNKSGRVYVRQSKPLPITILAVIPEVSVGGS